MTSETVEDDQRGVVGPVQVVDRDEHRAASSQLGHPHQHRLATCRLHARMHAAQRTGFPVGRRALETRRTVEILDPANERIDQGSERAAPIQLLKADRDYRDRALQGTPAQLGKHARLADARLAAKDRDVATAGRQRIERRVEAVEHVLSADQRKAILWRFHGAHHRVERSRPIERLERLRSA